MLTKLKNICIYLLVNTSISTTDEDAVKEKESAILKLASYYSKDKKVQGMFPHNNNHCYSDNSQLDISLSLSLYIYISKHKVSDKPINRQYLLKKLKVNISTSITCLYQNKIH